MKRVDRWARSRLVGLTCGAGEPRLMLGGPLFWWADISLR
jgi:hypothetical protein